MYLKCRVHVGLDVVEIRQDITVSTKVWSEWDSSDSVRCQDYKVSRYLQEDTDCSELQWT